jgi:hypothetical protein
MKEKSCKTCKQIAKINPWLFGVQILGTVIFFFGCYSFGQWIISLF